MFGILKTPEGNRITGLLIKKVESHANTASSKDIKEFRYSPLNSVCTMCDFVNYGTDYMYV